MPRDFPPKLVFVLNGLTMNYPASSSPSLIRVDEVHLNRVFCLSSSRITAYIDTCRVPPPDRNCRERLRCHSWSQKNNSDKKGHLVYDFVCLNIGSSIQLSIHPSFTHPSSHPFSRALCLLNVYFPTELHPKLYCHFLKDLSPPEMFLNII